MTLKNTNTQTQRIPQERMKGKPQTHIQVGVSPWLLLSWIPVQLLSWWFPSTACSGVWSLPSARSPLVLEPQDLPRSSSDTCLVSGWVSSAPWSAPPLGRFCIMTWREMKIRVKRKWHRWLVVLMFSHLIPILQSITQGKSNSASRSSIWLYFCPSFSTSPW